MAKIIGGIGASHSPTIAFAKDTNKASHPDWAPIFEGFSALEQWVKDKAIDSIVLIFNDHITSFFFDHYSAFTLGVDDQYHTADEGGGARDFPAVNGDVELSRHIGRSLMADEFDMAFFQKKPLDHGFFSPLSMICPDVAVWGGKVIPLQVGVLQLPIPSAKRCYKLGKALRKAIQSYPKDINVAILATGGLSHQVHGERCGFNNEAWDLQFLDLLEKAPQQLADTKLAEFAERGGMEGAEVIMWLIMRGALSDQVRNVHQSTYLPSMTNIATLILEDTEQQPDLKQIQQQQKHIQSELAGVEKLSGTYPFDLEKSHKAYRLNAFLRQLIVPAHRQRFLNDFVGLARDFELTDLEIDMVNKRQWIALIQYGVIFFVLEKLAAVSGISNPQVYASMRGETLEAFQKTRKVSMQYSVAGGDAAANLQENKQ